MATKIHKDSVTTVEMTDAGFLIHVRHGQMDFHSAFEALAYIRHRNIFSKISKQFWDTEIIPGDFSRWDCSSSLFWLSGGENAWGDGRFIDKPWSDHIDLYTNYFYHTMSDDFFNKTNFGEIYDTMKLKYDISVFLEFALKYSVL